MFDPFMMGGMPGGFGMGGYEMDDGLDPYGMEPEMDEHQEMLIRIAACMPLYKCDTFEDTLENACYVCNIEKESLSEEDLDFLEEMYEEEE